MTVPTVGRHVIAQQHDQVGIERISRGDNPLQLLVVNEWRASVNICDQSDAQAGEFGRPVVDLNCLLVNDQAIGLDQK